MMVNELTNKVFSICDVVYHNLRVARQSVFEIEVLLRLTFTSSRLSQFFGKYFLPSQIDIHNRNVLILFSTLFEGKCSLREIGKFIENNAEGLNLPVSPIFIRESLERTRLILCDLSTKYFARIQKGRNKFAAHQDKINYGDSRAWYDVVLSTNELWEILEGLERAFSILYTDLLGKEYAQIEPRSVYQLAEDYLWSKTTQ